MLIHDDSRFVREWLDSLMAGHLEGDRGRITRAGPEMFVAPEHEGIGELLGRIGMRGGYFLCEGDRVCFAHGGGGFTRGNDAAVLHEQVPAQLYPIMYLWRRARDCHYQEKGSLGAAKLGVKG